MRPWSRRRQWCPSRSSSHACKTRGGGWSRGPGSEKYQIFSSSYSWDVPLRITYLQTNLTGEGYREDIVSFAEIIIPRIVLVHRILGSDGNTEHQSDWSPVIFYKRKLPGEADDDHDELVEGGSTDKPVDQLSNTADIINIRLYFDQGKSF